MRKWLRKWLGVDADLLAAGARMDQIDRGCMGMADQWNAEFRGYPERVLELEARVISTERALEGRGFSKLRTEMDGLLGTIAGLKLDYRIGDGIAEEQDRLRSRLECIEGKVGEHLLISNGHDKAIAGLLRELGIDQGTIVGPRLSGMQDRISMLEESTRLLRDAITGEIMAQLKHSKLPKSTNGRVRRKVKGKR